MQSFFSGVRSQLELPLTLSAFTHGTHIFSLHVFFSCSAAAAPLLLLLVLLFYLPLCKNPFSPKVWVSFGRITMQYTLHWRHKGSCVRIAFYLTNSLDIVWKMFACRRSVCFFFFCGAHSRCKRVQASPRLRAYKRSARRRRRRRRKHTEKLFYNISLAVCNNICSVARLLRAHSFLIVRFSLLLHEKNYIYIYVCVYMWV